MDFFHVSIDRKYFLALYKMAFNDLIGECKDYSFEIVLSRLLKAVKINVEEIVVMDRNIDDLMKGALKQLQMGRLPSAKINAQKIIKLKPLHAGAFHLLGLISTQSGELKSAVTNLKTAIKINPSALMHFNLGLVFEKQKKISAAEKSFLAALELKPDYIQVLHKLSHLQLKLGNPGAALDSLERLIKIKPDAGAYHGMGVLLGSLGQRDAAINAYKKSLSLNADSIKTLNSLGILMRQKNEMTAAVEYFNRSLSIDSEHTTSMINLGVAMKLQGNLDQAEDCFKQALGINPSLSDAHHYLGQVFNWKGKLEKSMLSNQRAIKCLLKNPPFPAQPRKTMVVDRARPVLLIIRERLNNANIPFFLCSGTLLGIYRDGDLLPYDKDMDIGVPWEVDRDMITKVLTGDGEFETVQNRRNEFDAKQRLIPVVHKKTGIILDMFFFEPAGDYYLCGFHHIPYPLLSKPHRFELAPISWQGVEWMVPADCDQYLTDIYGPDWGTPDPHFDTAVSSFCQTSESKTGRLCFGYDRLYMRLRNQQMDKAIGYCRQMLKLKHDPFLVDLLTNIQSGQ